MMMPAVDQSPLHHQHHQSFFHQQSLPEQTGKMQLTLILPNGVPSAINVDANTPMMDLLIQATSSNKLNPSNYSLVVLDSNQHVIHFKPNQTVGQIVRNCQLPQINGSSSISLLPKETTHPAPSSKSKAQPFEITVRLQINLPDAQKILLRVDPTLPLYEIKEQICKQKKYTDSNRYTLRLPQRLDKALMLGLSLAEYKTNELTLVRLKPEQKSDSNQIQSFDRLYRTRSESQPPEASAQETSNEEQQSTNTRQRPASVQLNSGRSPTQLHNVTSLPAPATHPPIKSHTSLHAYWNDPNFDTQSQLSNCSSSTKKRRAPQAPIQLSPTTVNHPREVSPVPIQLHPDQHRDSHESLTENNNGVKQKRKAPILTSTNVSQENTKTSDLNLSSTVGNTTEHIHVPPTSEHVNVQKNDEQTNEQAWNMSDEPRNINIIMTAADQQRIVELLSEQRTPPQARLVITTGSPERMERASASPEPIDRNLNSSPPIYSQIQKNKENPAPTESPYSTVKSTPTPSVPLPEDQVDSPSSSYSITELVHAGIAAPPAPASDKQQKITKQSDATGGLFKIINDHKEIPEASPTSEKQEDSVSYFRVAKSRCGKFETDDRGFVNTSSDIFDAVHNPEKQQQQQQQPAAVTNKTTENVTRQTVVASKPVPVTGQAHSKGKQAYELLKKYEKEDVDDQHRSLDVIDTEYLKTQTPLTVAQKPSTPIQLEVTERTTHISVTVESDRKQLITRASPVPSSSSSTSTAPPSVLAPKPFGKTITEYRTVRRIGTDGEAKTTTTVRTETIPPKDKNDGPTTTTTHSETQRGSLMDSIREFGGAENLNKQ